MNALAHTIAYTPKKRLIKSGVVIFGVLVLGYLIMMGSIISQSVAREKLKRGLAAELHSLQETESSFVARGGTIASFIQHGYEEPQSLEVIKRIRNVAENTHATFY